MNRDDTGGERVTPGDQDREQVVPEEGRADKARSNTERVGDDPTGAAAAGATGVVAGSVTGATVGQGMDGSLGGAVVGSLVGADLADKAADEDEELPPVDFDKLSQFGSGEAAPTIAEQIEEGSDLSRAAQVPHARDARDEPDR